MRAAESWSTSFRQLGEGDERGMHNRAVRYGASSTNVGESDKRLARTSQAATEDPHTRRNMATRARLDPSKLRGAIGKEVSTAACAPGSRGLV